MSASQPPFAAAWLRQRTVGDRAVAEVEAAELAALDDAAALAQTRALLSIPIDPEQLEERRSWSGLVEQQRAFHRSRR